VISLICEGSVALQCGEGFENDLLHYSQRQLGGFSHDPTHPIDTQFFFLSS